jgi:hypothetical protein
VPVSKDEIGEGIAKMTAKFRSGGSEVFVAME